MGDTEKSILQKVREISSLDVLIARIEREQRELKSAAEKRKNQIGEEEKRSAVRQKLMDEKKTLYNREEKSLRDNRDKLNERRKALDTLNNYKLQQAALREVDFSSKELSGREDQLIGLLGEVSTLEDDITKLSGSIKELQTSSAAYEAEIAATLEETTARMQEYQKERQEIASSISDQTSLTTYRRAKDKYPHDPVVPLKDGQSCTGCYMKVGPQILVQVSRGEIVRCPGCGRIVHLSDKEKVD